jgi:hypothetical protein
MIFHVDRLSDDQMNQWMGEFTTQVWVVDSEAILTLAAGRPGIIMHYQQLWVLDEVVASRKSIQSQIKSWTIAQLYQQISAINKSDYLSIIIDALLMMSEKSWDRTLYDATFDLIRKQESNVNIENLLFERCCRIRK